eukprot:TRINITY_DN30891_c0_g1_i1.p1 TRINITY_DN30891_c0_g1~~TRINITY_DN30891_c0_g1_i1.p1  ORF type:complete len:711 (+),score=104.54 TRINITY_DN30891_c0_g1_i1:20-2152(+)
MPSAFEQLRVGLDCFVECPEVGFDQSEQLLVSAHLTAPEMPEGTARCPVAVTAVIDRSGSMAGPKLALVKDTLSFIISNIKDEDQLGIISYDDYVQENLTLSRMDASGQERANESVRALDAGDNTNLSDGLLAGIDQLRGVPLTGYTQKAAIAAVEASNRKKRFPTDGPFNLNACISSMIQPADRDIQQTVWTISLELGAYQDSISELIDSVSIKLPDGMPQQDGATVVTEPPFEFIFTGCPPGPPGVTPVRPGIVGRFFHRDRQQPMEQKAEVNESPAEPPTRAGLFRAGVTIVFKPRFGSVVHHTEHHIDFEQEMASTAFDVTLTDLHPPPPVVPQAVPVVRQTAFSQLEREAQRAVRLRTMLLCWQRVSSSLLASDVVEEVFEFMRTVLVSSVWLFTDGLANKGIVVTDQIKAEEETKLSTMKDPCSIFTFGFGTDHDPNMLRAISDAGNGMYYFIDKEESIPNSFTDCLGGLLSVVAKDIKLQLTANHDLCTISKVMTKYRSSIDPDGRSATVTMRDLYSEEERDVVVLLNFLPRTEPTGNSMPCLTWQLSYYNVLNKQHEVSTSFTCVARPEVTDPARRDPPAELDRQRNRIACTDAMEKARLLADQGEMPEARRVLTAVVETVSRSKTAQDEFCRGLLEDVNTCLAQLRTREHYSRMGQKTMQNMETCHAMQRSCGHGAWYTNKAKSAMTSKYWSSRAEDAEEE